MYWNRLPRAVMDAPSLETCKAGWSSEQPDLVIGVPDDCKKVELDDL